MKSAGRSSLLPETINTILHISLNGKGAAFFDPRPALYEFLSSRERRNREPNKELYQQRDFVKHFFTEKSGFCDRCVLFLRPLLSSSLVYRHLKYFIRALSTLILFLLDILGFYDKRLDYFHILDSEH